RRDRSAGGAARSPAHLQSVRHSYARARRAEAPPRRARHWQRDLLPGPVPSAAVLRESRLSAWSIPARRARRRREPRDSDLRRADRGAAAVGRLDHRAVRPSERRSRAVIRAGAAVQPSPAARRLPSLTTQIFIGLLLGIVVGSLWPGFGVAVKPLA